MHKNFGAVNISICDSNALVILGRCQAVARHSGISKEAWDSFLREALSDDFEKVLACVVEHFDVQMTCDESCS